MGFVQMSAVSRWVRSLVLLLSLVVLSSSPSFAAVITWGAVTDIGPDDLSLVQPGTVVQALNFGGPATTPTASGVSFSAAATPPGATAATGLALANSDPQFNTALNSKVFRFGGGSTFTVTLTGLTNQQAYSVQLFVADNRSTAPNSQFANRTQRFSDGLGNNSGTLRHGGSAGQIGGQYVIGTFTASGTTQTIVVTGLTGGGGTDLPTAILNALVLRRVPEVNAASGLLPFLAVLMVMLVGADRRLRA